jgi:hypothetical protein
MANRTQEFGNRDLAQLAVEDELRRVQDGSTLRFSLDILRYKQGASIAKNILTSYMKPVPDARILASATKINVHARGFQTALIQTLLQAINK